MFYTSLSCRFGFSILFLLFTISHTSSQDKVPGETRSVRAAPTRAPYQASLRNSRNVHGCSAAIINRRWLITAASCHKFADNVLVGSTALYSRTAPVLQVRQFIACGNGSGAVPPRAAPSVPEVALVLTATAMQLGPAVAPVALARAPPSPDEELMLTGWGYTLFPGLYHKFDGSLRAGSVRVLAGSACRSPRTTPAHVCALSLPSEADASCLGDPGSPAVSHGRLAALVVRGAACVEHAPELLAAVHIYRAWALEVIAAVAPIENQEWAGAFAADLATATSLATPHMELATTRRAAPPNEDLRQLFEVRELVSTSPAWTRGEARRAGGGDESDDESNMTRYVGAEDDDLAEMPDFESTMSDELIQADDPRPATIPRIPDVALESNAKRIIYLYVSAGHQLKSFDNYILLLLSLYFILYPLKTY